MHGSDIKCARERTILHKVTHVFVLEMRKWTSTHVQKVRERFLGNNHEGADDVKRGTQQQRRQLQQQKKDKKAKQKQKQDSGSGSGSGSCCGGSDHEKHGTTGGAEKRRQGEVVAQFLVDILAGLSSTTTMLATRSSNRPADGAASAGGGVGSKAIPHDDAGVAAPDDAGVAAALQHRLRAAKLLNAGTGVIDVAGGSGHVSLAFVSALFIYLFSFLKHPYPHTHTHTHTNKHHIHPLTHTPTHAHTHTLTHTLSPSLSLTHTRAHIYCR